MANFEKPTYEFGPFRLDTEQRLLLKEGVRERLGHKAFDLLTVLVQNHGRITTKETLLKSVWPDTFVEEGVLTTNISQLRKVLGEGYVETHHGTGYCFIKPVRVVRPRDEPDDKNEADPQEQTYLVEERIRGRVIIEPAEHGSEALTTVGPTDDLVPLGQRLLTRARAIYKLRPMLVIALILAIAVVAARYFLIPGPKQVKSIAVLPFSIGGENANPNFGLGLTADCVREIGTLKNVKVRPTEEVVKYVDTDLTPSAVGRELGVEAVLSGKMWIQGERVTGNVELRRVDDDALIWSRSFEKKLTDLVRKGDDSIAEQVARQLKIKLTTDEKKRLERGGTEDTDAYNLYLSGRSLFSQRKWKEARESFEKAVAKDDNFALALAAEAECLAILGSSGGDSPPRENLLQAYEKAFAALKVDNSLAEAYASVGIADLFYYWNKADAEKQLLQALVLNRNCPMARYWYAVYLTADGKLDQAIEEARAAEESDRSSPVMSIGVARAMYYAGHYDDAIAQCKKILERFGDIAPAHFMLAVSLQQKEKYSEAIVELHRMGGEQSPLFRASLATLDALQGNYKEANRILKQLENPSKDEFVSPTYTATIYTALGKADKSKLDKAFDSLNQACDRDHRASEMVFLEIEPMFLSLHNDPRFKELLQRVKPL